MRMCPACGFDRCDDTAEWCRQCGADLSVLDEEERIPSAESSFFHYLQIPTIGTLELIPGRALRIGRERRNELVLPKCKYPLVATLFWTDGYDELTIEEHGTPELVKVEGFKIKGKRTLKGGEELHIGAIRMSYVKRATRLEGAISTNRAKKPRGGGGARQAFEQKTKGRRAATALEPNTRQLTPQKKPAPRTVIAAPAQVAAALEKSKATGTLRVSSSKGRGWVTMVSGKPQYAAFGEHKAVAALGAILRQPRCRCMLVPELPKRGFGDPMSMTFSQMLGRIARASGKRPVGRPPARGRGRGTGRRRRIGRRPPPRGRR
jgi:hypothetical protein